MTPEVKNLPKIILSTGVRGQRCDKCHKKVKKGGGGILTTFVAPDGAQAFWSAGDNAGKTVLKGVNHNKKVFTPTTKVLKSTLDRHENALLKKQTKGKDACVKETKLYYILPAGDNSAESHLGHVKNQLRRAGGLGRSNVKSTRKSVQGRAAAAMLRRAGFLRVAEALRLYREACCDGTIRISPGDAFNPDKCSWIFQS